MVSGEGCLLYYDKLYTFDKPHSTFWLITIDFLPSSFQKGSMAHHVPPNYMPPNYPMDGMPPNCPMDYIPLNQDHVPIQVVTHMPQRQIVYVEPPMPKDYVIWSVLSLIFCNPFCLGFVAFCYSIKVSIAARLLLLNKCSKF